MGPAQTTASQSASEVQNTTSTSPRRPPVWFEHRTTFEVARPAGAEFERWSVSGFVKLHRALLDSALWQGLTAGQRTVMIALLLRANWRDSEVYDRRTRRRFVVPRGSLIDSQDSIASDAGVTRKVVRSALDNLEAGGFLSRSDGPLWGRSRGQTSTLITICNFDKYQDQTVGEGHREGRNRDTVGVTVRPTVGVTEGDRSEEEKKRRTEEARALPAPTFGDQPHERLALTWLSALKASKPSHRNVLTPQAVAAARRPYAQACQQLLKRGDAKRIEAVRDWAWTRDFWRSKTRTPGQLVKVWDKVTDEMPDASARPPVDPRRAIERSRQEAAQRRGEAPLPEVDQLSLRIYKAEQQVASLRSARARGETGAAERCAEAEEKLRGLRNALVRAARG